MAGMRVFLFAIAFACAGFAIDPPGAAPLAAGHPNLPNGYELVAQLKCGAGADRVEAGSVGIALTRGAVGSLPEAPSGVTGVAADPEQVEFKIGGLNGASRYVVGFTWWGGALDGAQSVRFRSVASDTWQTVLPHALPAAFHADQPTFARVHLPVPAAYAKEGGLGIAFAREAGEKAFVNELWLLRETDTAPRKRIVLITGDDWTGHLWRETGPVLAGALREDPRLEVTITESPSILASPLVLSYDAAVLHFKNYQKRLSLGKDVWNGLEQFVHAGHGLVLVHFGCGAFEEWRGFVNVAGRVWDPQRRGHDPYGPFSVRRVNGDHPLNAGMQSFDTEDELYTCLVGDSKIDVLFEARSRVDQQLYPLAFVVPELAARVFHCTLGHDAHALASPGTRALYRCATSWAAGLSPAP